MNRKMGMAKLQSRKILVNILLHFPVKSILQFRFENKTANGDVVVELTVDVGVGEIAGGGGFGMHLAVYDSLSCREPLTRSSAD
ncbi:hypothetical protein C5167_030075 [Papaver somniferum]|nr:hypothetical protein C5167_030075 [Papaver somniferum]